MFRRTLSGMPNALDVVPDIDPNNKCEVDRAMLAALHDAKVGANEYNIDMLGVFLKKICEIVFVLIYKSFYFSRRTSSCPTINGQRTTPPSFEKTHNSQSNNEFYCENQFRV